MKQYEVSTRRWERGWELHVAGIGVTQVRTLDQAVGQVCDLIETMTGTAATEDQVTLSLDLGGLETAAVQAREASDEAEARRSEAARAIRKVARDLRTSGLSVTDIATILGVSRGRVSQYLSSGTQPSERHIRRPRLPQ